MGFDSIEPFTKYKDKAVYILALTSNPGGNDFQRLKVDGKELYEIIIGRYLSLNKNNNTGFVFGANHTSELNSFTKQYPDVPLLRPGRTDPERHLDPAAGVGGQLGRDTGAAPASLPGRRRIMQEYFQVDSLNLTAEERAVNRLRIAVQHASGNPRLGRQVAHYLESHGFRNVYVTRDWPNHQAETQIIAQQGDLQGAASLETLLGLGQVVAASTGDLESDLTIRVGSDWIKHLEGL